MDQRLFWTVFSTVFVAEIGDKTQLATVLYAGSAVDRRWTVFIASALALTLTSALGTFLGSWLGPLVDGKAIRWIAGLGFIGVGVWTIVRG